MRTFFRKCSARTEHGTIAEEWKGNDLTVHVVKNNGDWIVKIHDEKGGSTMRSYTTRRSASRAAKNLTDKPKKMYMNLATGSVDDYDGWWYHDEDGDFVNAVDLGEVVEVEWNDKAGIWVEV
jgi:hypothetical protein